MTEMTDRPQFAGLEQLDRLELRTPNGNDVVFLARHGTNDANTVNSASSFDEYGLKGLELAGWALDLGTHIGGVAIPLAVDHPELHVVCVEPVPENAELIRRNAELNDVAKRIRVLEAACGAPGTRTAVRYGFRNPGGEFDHHAWIGNAELIYANPPVEAHDTVTVECLDLTKLASHGFDFPPALIKVDAEGGEWDALEQIVKLAADRVVGEWHPVCGRSNADEIVDAFRFAGYEITTSGPAAGPGGFTATR